MDERAPKSIGRYEVDRLLGAGAMGNVYLGRDPDLDRAVAIKTVRNLEMDPEALATFLERFRNEARAAAKLHHPNIVQVYDVGESPELGPYLVFEYVAGSTLKQILRSRGALAPAGVVRLALEIGEALAVAHAQGIIHRDLKPDNLLVTPDGQTKLADFGVARIPNAALTREGQFLGTPCYAAPETLRHGRYGVHSDLFSFAAVLYEAATGERAFPGDDAVAVAHRVIHDDPAPPREIAERPADLPAGVAALLTQGLAKDPAARFDGSVAFADAMRAAYVDAGLVDEAAARSGSRRFPLQVGSEASGDGGRGGIAFAAVLVGALVLGLALVFGSDPADPDPALLDAGVPSEPDLGPGDLGEELAPLEDLGTQHALPDAPRAPDQGAEDLGVEAGPEELGAEDAGDAGEAPMTPHEREEAAKDALFRARFALDEGDVAEARAALEEARRYDPENPDIAALAARLVPAEPPSGPASPEPATRPTDEP
ncbi:MAG: serine/threonine-protein kinase [Myxococcota bacterium]